MSPEPTGTGSFRPSFAFLDTERLAESVDARAGLRVPVLELGLRRVADPGPRTTPTGPAAAALPLHLQPQTGTRPERVGPNDSLPVRLAVAEADDRPRSPPPRPSSRAAPRPPARGTDRPGRRRASARRTARPSGRAPGRLSRPPRGTSSSSAETTSPPRFESLTVRTPFFSGHLPRLRGHDRRQRRPARPAQRPSGPPGRPSASPRPPPPPRSASAAPAAAAPASAPGRPGSRGSGWRPRGRKPRRDVSNPMAAPRRRVREPGRTRPGGTGDNGKGAGSRATPPSGGRGGESIRERTPNRSAGTGRPEEEAARGTSCRAARSSAAPARRRARARPPRVPSRRSPGRRRGATSFSKSRESSAKSVSLRPGADVHDDVDGRAKPAAPAKQLPELPAKPVPHDGGAGLLRDRHAEPGTRTRARASRKRPASGRRSVARWSRCPDSRPDEGPGGPSRTTPRRRVAGASRPGPLGSESIGSKGPPGTAVSSGASDGEALPTLGPATGKDGPAVLRPHPDEEAVRLVAAAVVGLERSLHGTTSPAAGSASGGFSGTRRPLSTARPVSPSRASPSEASSPWPSRAGCVLASPPAPPSGVLLSHRWRCRGQVDLLGENSRAPEVQGGRARLRHLVPRDQAEARDDRRRLRPHREPPLHRLHPARIRRADRRGRPPRGHRHPRDPLRPRRSGRLPRDGLSGSPPGPGEVQGRRPESPLHVRALRHRQVQPARPRRGPPRCRPDLPPLQPPLHLRPDGSRQDPPHAGDRPPPPLPPPGREDPLRLSPRPS